MSTEPEAAPVFLPYSPVHLGQGDADAPWGRAPGPLVLPDKIKSHMSGQHAELSTREVLIMMRELKQNMIECTIQTHTPLVSDAMFMRYTYS